MMKMSKELRASVEDYLDRYHIPLRLVLRTDVTVALIRVGTPEALAKAEEMLGRKIPVTLGQLFKERKIKRKDPVPRVSSVKPRVYRRRGRWTMPKRTEERFQKIQVGMTRDQLLRRGVPPRDIARWTKSGNIAWSSP